MSRYLILARFCVSINYRLNSWQKSLLISKFSALTCMISFPVVSDFFYRRGRRGRRERRERFIIPMLLDLRLIQDLCNVLICLISFLVVSDFFYRRGRRGHRERREKREIHHSYVTGFEINLRFMQCVNLLDIVSGCIGFFLPQRAQRTQREKREERDSSFQCYRI